MTDVHRAASQRRWARPGEREKMRGNRNAAGAVRSVEYRRRQSESQLRRYARPGEKAQQRERMAYARSKVRFGVSRAQLALGLMLLNAGYDVYAEVPVDKPGHGCWFIDWWDPEHRIAWEMDGWFHTFSERQQADAERDRVLATRGITTVRLTLKDIQEFRRECGL